MNTPNIPANLTEEDAFHIIVDDIRTGEKTEFSTYGYDLHLPHIIHRFLVKCLSTRDSTEINKHIPKLSPIFYNAAWDMCRRGILRPSMSNSGQHTHVNGASGNGYSITSLGKEWLSQSNNYDYVPIELGRLSRLLSQYNNKFGLVYAERSQEAIKCYNSIAYLACCVMCGAATESIMITLAIAKTKDDKMVIKQFSSAGGRRKIENIIIGTKPQNIKEDFLASTSLLKYWRDISAHGRISGITENEAFTSLAMLLRFSQFVNEKWEELLN